MRASRRVRLAAAVLLGVGLMNNTAGAQPVVPPPLPAGFVGAGFGPSSSDAASRMRLYQEVQAWTWIVEAGGAVSSRFGLGVEYSQPTAARAFTTIGLGRAQISGRQEERVLLGLVRARLGGAGRWAADAVAGAGVLFRHHAIGGCTPAVFECEDTSGPAIDERSPALTAGLELPIRIAPRFAIVPSARAYFLRRGEQASTPANFLPWQYEWTSSARAAFVLSGRLTW